MEFVRFTHLRAVQTFFVSGHPQIGLPLRSGDLFHSRGAILARTEELIALERIPPEQVDALEWGFLLKTSACAQRLWERYKTKSSHHLWLDSVEADQFGTHIFFSHQFVVTPELNPFYRPLDLGYGAYTAVCSWREANEVATWLRKEHIAPRLLTAYGADLLTITSAQITLALRLSEGSFNSALLPHYCPTQWGTLLRIDRTNLGRVLEYFNLEEPADCSIPVIDQLGGGLSILYALSPLEEALRVAICSAELEHLALHDLGSWLRSIQSSKAKKELASANH